MKTPSFLLGATLLFWGWQADYFWTGLVLGLALEAARFVKARWDFSDEDFSRLWVFCSVLFLGAAFYSFTVNEGPSKFGAWLQSPTGSNTSGAGRASSETAATLFRWLPMIFFPFVAAQAYSPRQEIPLTIISQILRRRWKKLAKEGRPMPATPGMNVGYPYFAICLFSASNHQGVDSRYFWGLSALLAWVLWTRRTRRFGVLVWLGALGAAIALAFGGQRGIGGLQDYITNLNPEWLANLMRRTGFDPTESETALGKIGRIKASGRIVIRLEPVSGAAPNYLRATTYREFKGRKWSVGNLHKDFDVLSSESDGTSWVLLPDKTNTARAKITCYLEGYSKESGMPMGLLPLPEGCSRLEKLPSYAILKRNGASAVLAEGPGLLMFQASHGPGATMDLPFKPDESLFGTNAVPADLEPGSNLNPDLDVPDVEKAALDQVIAGLGITNRSPEEQLRAVNGFFMSGFSYSLWQEIPKGMPTNQTPLSRFLLKTRSGHCEYFATATVLLLRELGIPARYAVGYVVHETSGDGYVVRQRDAHAWCIVWDGRARLWRNFDTTPASWVAEEQKQASSLQWLSDLWSWGKLQFSKFRWGQTRLRQYLLWGLVPVLAVLVYQIVFRRKKRRRGGAAAAGAPDEWPGSDSEFYLVEGKLEERGVARRPDEPLSGWLERALKADALAEIRGPLRELLRLHYRCRFDPRGITPEDREELRRNARAVLKKLEEQ